MRTRINEEVQCPICLDNVKYAVETCCNHMFCGECVIELIRSTNTTEICCPLCRRKIAMLLTCFTLEETNTTNLHEVNKRVEINTEINNYNTAIEWNESLWHQLWDLPVLLRHIWAEMFTSRGLAFLSKTRIVVLFIIGLIYGIAPIDLIPEAFLGLFGLIDDIFVISYVLLQAGVIYRTHVAART